MYYEESFHDGKVWCRHVPRGEWQEMPLAVVWASYQDARREAARLRQELAERGDAS